MSRDTTKRQVTTWPAGYDSVQPRYDWSQWEPQAAASPVVTSKPSFDPPSAASSRRGTPASHASRPHHSSQGNSWFQRPETGSLTVGTRSSSSDNGGAPLSSGKMFAPKPKATGEKAKKQGKSKGRTEPKDVARGSGPSHRQPASAWSSDGGAPLYSDAPGGASLTETPTGKRSTGNSNRAFQVSWRV